MGLGLGWGWGWVGVRVGVGVRGRSRTPRRGESAQLCRCLVWPGVRETLATLVRVRGRVRVRVRVSSVASTVSSE